MAQDLWQFQHQILSIIFLKEFNRIKCNFGHDDKKCEKRGINYRDRFLEYTNFKEDSVKYKYLYCNKNYQHKFHEKLKE